MAYSVLLGFADDALAAQASALLAEDDELAVVATAGNAGDVMGTLGGGQVEVAILHEDLGPLPLLDLAREVVGRYPYVGVVLVVKERTPEILRSALQAGARDVLALPLSFEELQGVKGAGAWAQALRRGAGAELNAVGLGAGGTVIAVAGAKGGVGATTLAVQLALEAALAQRDADEAGVRRGPSVCLADFDLQAGDVGLLLDLTHRRSIVDLLEVSHEIGPRVLEDALYLHKSGVRVLLAPDLGEQAEDISGGYARRILAALRANFDITIVDVGTSVSEGNAVAVEMADRVLVVTTPDVPALRSVNRLLGLWERLEIRKDDIDVVVNRVNRDTEVQPDLVRKVVEAPLLRTTLPASFRDLEPAVNTGVPTRLDDGHLKAGIRNVAREIGIVPTKSDRKRRLLGQSGQIAVEGVGIGLVIALVALILWQLVLVAFTFVLAGHSAREGAHALSVDGEVRQSAEGDVPGAWRNDMRVREDEREVSVTLGVPVIVPGLNGPFEITGRAQTIVENEPLPDEFDG